MIQGNVHSNMIQGNVHLNMIQGNVHLNMIQGNVHANEVHCGFCSEIKRTNTWFLGLSRV